MSTSLSSPWKIFRWPLTPYLSSDATDNIRKYQYSGGDNGLVFKYFYNPLALKLVSYLPDTLA